MPSRSATPGLKPSITTSLAAIRLRAFSKQAADFRSSTTLALLRLNARYRALNWPSGPKRDDPQLRAPSPPGGSTLTTSAPKSASSIEQSGPAIACVKSSTRMPSSGGVTPATVSPFGRGSDEQRLVDDLVDPPLHVDGDRRRAPRAGELAQDELVQRQVVPGARRGERQLAQQRRPLVVVAVGAEPVVADRAPQRPLPVELDRLDRVRHRVDDGSALERAAPRRRRGRSGLRAPGLANPL